MAYPVANPMESFMQGFQGMSNVIDQRKRTQLAEDEFAMRKSEYDRIRERQQMQDSARFIAGSMMGPDGEFDISKANALIGSDRGRRAIGGLLRNELGFDGDIEGLVPDADGSLVVHVRQKDGTVGPLVRFADDDDPNNDEVARLSPDEVPQLLLGAFSVYDPEGFARIQQSMQTSADQGGFESFYAGLVEPQTGAPSLESAATTPGGQPSPLSRGVATADGLAAAAPTATPTAQQPTAQQPTAQQPTAQQPPAQQPRQTFAGNQWRTEDDLLLHTVDLLERASRASDGLRAASDSKTWDARSAAQGARGQITAAQGELSQIAQKYPEIYARAETMARGEDPNADRIQAEARGYAERQRLSQGWQDFKGAADDIATPIYTGVRDTYVKPALDAARDYVSRTGESAYNQVRSLFGLGAAQPEPQAPPSRASASQPQAPASQPQAPSTPARAMVPAPTQPQAPQRQSIRQAETQVRSAVSAAPNAMSTEQKDKLVKNLARLTARGKLTIEGAQTAIDRAMGRSKVKEMVTIGDDIVALDEYGKEITRYVGGALNSKDRASIEYSRSLARYYQSGGKAGSGAGTDVKFGDRMKFLKSAQDLLGVKPDKNPDAASWLVNGIADASARGLIDISNPEVALGQIGNAYNAAMGMREDPWFGDPESLNQGANLTQILTNLQFSANSSDWENILPPEPDLQVAESTGFARADVHQAVVEAAIALQQERGMDKNSALALAKQSVMDSVRRYAQGGGR